MRYKKPSLFREFGKLDSFLDSQKLDEDSINAYAIVACISIKLIQKM